jgi:hypothetical protein
MENYIGTKKKSHCNVSLEIIIKKEVGLTENEDPNKEGYFIQYSDDCYLVPKRI